MYTYCIGNPIGYTDPSGYWIWGVVGAVMGAYDGYMYAKKKKLSGWKMAAAIVGGAALSAINPFKVVKAASKVVKVAKFTKKAKSGFSKLKAAKRILKKPKLPKVKIKKCKPKVKRPKAKRVKKAKVKENKCCGTNGCFVAGTKVLTKKGFTPIEDIKPGDYVWSENPNTNEKALKKVKKIFVREKDSIIRLRINGEVISTTEEHPFYVENVGFIPAGKLKEGDQVRIESGETAIIESVKVIKLKKSIRVYNFEVEDFHTYYVADQKVLVHNKCPKERVTENGTKIIGGGHGKNAHHKNSIDKKIEEMAKTGEYKEIYGDRQLKTAGLKGRERPDIIGIRKDGTIEIYEFASPSQAKGAKRKALEEKVSRMKEKYPDAKNIELFEWGEY